MPLWMVYMVLSERSPLTGKPPARTNIFITAWGFRVARFDEQGNARAFQRWSGRQVRGSTFFFCVCEDDRINNNLEGGCPTDISNGDGDNNPKSLPSNRHKTMKDIKYFFQAAFLLSIAAVGFCSCKDSITIEYESPVADEPSLSNVTLKVYLENSGSMDGYMCPGSELKDAVYDYLGRLKPEFGETELYYINSQIISRPNDLKSFIATLDPDSFKKAGGNRSDTDMGDLIEKVVKESSDNSVTIFISDCILALNNASPKDFFVNRQIAIRTAITKAMKENNNLSVEVVQLESKFDGTYYYGDGRKAKLNGEKRPYYMWIIGSNEMLAEMNKKAPIEEIKHGVENWVSFSKQQAIPFETTNKYGNPPKKIFATKNAYEILVKADMASILKPQESLLIADNYSTSKAISISSIDRKEGKIVLSVSINKTIKSREETIKYIDANKLPGWVEVANNDSCDDIMTALDQTTGIKYLIGGVADAYKNVETLGEITLKLKINYGRIF